MPSFKYCFGKLVLKRPEIEHFVPKVIRDRWWPWTDPNVRTSTKKNFTLKNFVSNPKNLLWDFKKFYSPTDQCCICIFWLLKVKKLFLDGLNLYEKSKLAWLFFAHVLELKMSLTSQGLRKMVSVAKGGHKAPTHCTGVSQFLVETSDIYALSNLTFVEHYNLSFLFMTIMTYLPPP